MDDAQARQRLTDLWVDHRDAVAAFVRRRLPGHEVDDVVSETFLVAWRRIEEVPDHDRAWLLTVARHVIATRARSYGRWRALAVLVAAQPAQDAPGAEDLAVDGLSLREAWSRLSHAEREVLALVAWDGLTSEEAARVLGCRRSTFSVRLVRARRHLLDLLEDEPRRPRAAVTPATAVPSP